MIAPTEARKVAERAVPLWQEDSALQRPIRRQL